MIRTVALMVSLGLAASTVPVLPTDPGARPKTWTGWFSDKSCASPRVARGDIGPNNPDCVKKCLDKGVTAVFISEQAKALFEVRDYPAVKDDVGWHIEVTGTVDDAAKTISVRSVKRLEYVGSTCSLRRKKTT
jgi:hypothetical protein